MTAKITTHQNTNGIITPVTKNLVGIQSQIPHNAATTTGHGKANPGSPPLPIIPTPKISA